jgi:hypothetical protein
MGLFSDGFYADGRKCRRRPDRALSCTILREIWRTGRNAISRIAAVRLAELKPVADMTMPLAGFARVFSVRRWTAMA